MRISVSIVTFLLTLYITGVIMNRDNVNTTRTMDSAGLPVVSVNYGGTIINNLYGYTSRMDISTLRDTITPLDDSRGVSFRVEKYGKKITGITARVRAVDDSRLIQVVEAGDYTEDDYNIFVHIEFKDLLERYTEYSLELELTMGDGRVGTYYTRIIDAPLYCSGEKLAFIENFDKKKWTTETNAELKYYMESNYLGDNTKLSFVNIHSSMSQLAFGNLSMTQLTDTAISIRELNTETAVFTAEYVARSNLYQEKKDYFVREYYRIKYTTDEIYLLDYERTMDEIHLDPKEIVRSGDILLGITDENVEILENDDGNTFVFAQGGTLYSYNISDNTLAVLFSFYDNDNFDLRTYNRDYEIKPLTIDEAGNVKYIVYGYMNRGNYEGRVGIALYDYNGVTNVNEEICFIGSDSAPEILRKNVDELSYMSPEGVLYLRIDEKIYAVDSLTNTYEVVVDNLLEDRYTISGDSSMLVWQEENDVNSSTHLKLMNLSNKEITSISAPSGDYIKPLSFIENDLVYGLAKKTDVVKDSTGRVIFPMYSMVIQNKFGKVLKNYQVPGVYVFDISIKDNLITMQRMARNDETMVYTSVENDYITDNQEQKVMQNIVNDFVNGDYQQCKRISLKKDNSGKVVLLTPREVIYEGNKELSFESDEVPMPHYYVYYKGELQAIYNNPAKAVTEADLNYGTVLNSQGFYVWYRANRLLKNQIMDMTTDETELEKESLPVCLDRIMTYEGEVRNSSYLLSTGKSVMGILSDNLEKCDCLDLRGCSLDSVLYYVNKDYPVLALLDDNEAKLIIGYNSLSIVINDPEKGTYKIGRNEAEELFSKNGNQFISYVHNY